MAKPKNTVDYFPHYCSHKTTMYILEDTYQNDGYALWFKLLELLGRTPHHYIDCSSIPTWKYILSCSHLSNDRAIEIIDLLADLRAIDKELWQYRIIWSDNFIQNIDDVYKKRHIPTPTKPSTNGKDRYKPVTEIQPMPPILSQDITEIQPMPPILENNTTKELKELKELNNIKPSIEGDKSPTNKDISFQYFQQLLKMSKTPLPTVVKAFKEWHKDAPESDFEHDNLYGYLGKMAKRLNNDYGYLLKYLWESVTDSIAGSHLNYINAKISNKLIKDKKAVIQQKQEQKPRQLKSVKELD